MFKGGITECQFCDPFFRMQKAKIVATIRVTLLDGRPGTVDFALCNDCCAEWKEDYDTIVSTRCIYAKHA